MLAEFGGDPGLRDRGLLEAAATMPRATFDCVFLHDGIPEMAAAYHYHLSQNHPFVDGNKRVALAAALVFLSLNELALDATDDELEGLASGLAEGRPDKSDVARFYRGKAV
ncbi:type II toxin-antitoxin system death-on-curing family toxin [bacterium]|nr:type II toxin-antitoxin system death-on-curing family toxin [bacterium]MBU1073783.1 type II toxin-antitoxin system death-on-curing family toxin [bacterium]MBU1676643.1 type II toxin-antitoxin system death-on-curing family toxin [bacterium]